MATVKNESAPYTLTEAALPQFPAFSQVFSEGCFSNGMARGTKEDLLAVMEACKQPRAKLQTTQIPGIFELNLGNFFPYGDGRRYLADLIRDFPALKVAGFLEDWSTSSVWIAYSESGCGHITHGKRINFFDPKSEYPWQWEYTPTENFKTRFTTIQTGDTVVVNYRFPYAQALEDRNYYVFRQGKSCRLVIREDAVQPLPFDSPKLWKLKRSQNTVDAAFIELYLGNETEVFFPQKVGNLTICGITKRCVNAPDNYKKIEKIHLPGEHSYYQIGENAFRGCIALKEVTIPQWMLHIADNAFADCTALETVTLPEIQEPEYVYTFFGLEKPMEKALGEGIFRNCTALKDVYLDSPLTQVSTASTFPGCPDYVVHGMPEWTVAEQNPGHFREMTPEDYLAMTSQTDWPIPMGFSTTANYQDLPYIGEWLEYSSGCLVRADRSKLPCDIANFAFAPLFSYHLVKVDYYGGGYICRFELYPKGHPHSDDVPAGKRMVYNSPKTKPFAGKIFVLDNQVPWEVEKRIRERGGDIKSSVVLKSDYLVITPSLNEDTPKRQRARELLSKGKSQVKIITVEEFFELIRK